MYINSNHDTDYNQNYEFDYEDCFLVSEQNSNTIYKLKVETRKSYDTINDKNYNLGQYQANAEVEWILGGIDGQFYFEDSDGNLMDKGERAFLGQNSVEELGKG